MPNILKKLYMATRWKFGEIVGDDILTNFLPSLAWWKTIENQSAFGEYGAEYHWGGQRPVSGPVCII